MNLYTQLISGTEADFLQIVKNWSIAPPNEAKRTVGGWQGVTGTALVDPVTGANRTVKVGTGEADATLHTTQYSDINLMKVVKPDKVCYLELQRAKMGAAGNEGANTLNVKAFGQPVANHVPAYFLPWQTGCSIRITIPDAAHIPHGAVDSHIFFTAAINGCSIFFQGSARNPTIFHSGGSPSMADGHATAAFWNTVNTLFVQEDVALGKAKGNVHATSVDKRQYVTQDGVTGATGTKSTNRAVLYENALRQKYATGRLQVEEVNPWGCVLGRRDTAGAWKFYLQENATVQYKQIARKLPGIGSVGGVKTASVSVPLHVREIFPGGTHQATIRRSLPKIV